MTDLLLNLSRSTLARTVVKTTKFPITLPTVLTRDDFPWRHQTLLGQVIAFGGRNSDSEVAKSLERILWDAGAQISPGDDSNSCTGLIFDATHLRSLADVRELFTFVQGQVRLLKTGSHVLIVGRVPLSTGQPAEAAFYEALSGFTRSLAKELGRKGSTANMIEIVDGAALDGAVRFFLSHHSAFITGQIIVLGASKSSSGERFESLLEERRILVTGAAQGIGAAIARKLAQEGAKLILLDRPQEMEALEALSKALNATILPVDLAKEESTSVVIKKLWELAPIAGVVHNAGVTRDRTLARMNQERWDQVMNINLHVPVSITDQLLSKEHEGLLAKDASIIFMSSVSGIAGNAGQTNYAASKSGLIGYARAMAAKHFNTGIRFNCIAPGFIETRMTAAIPFAVREVARRFNSLNQGGEPRDVAEAVTWLISGAGASVNGQTLRVCGQNLIGA